MALGDNIKKHRKAKKLTQGELGEKVGVSAMMISFIENGEKIPSLATAKRISQTLEVSLDELVNY